MSKTNDAIYRERYRPTMCISNIDRSYLNKKTAVSPLQLRQLVLRRYLPFVS